MLPIKRKINNDVEYDSILIWYRDENGEKKTRFIERAEVPYYIIKDKTCEEAITPPMFIERDKVEKFTTYSDLLYREIAMKTDSLSYWDRVALNWGPKSSNMKNLLKHNYIYNADMDVADRYIKNFYDEFDPDPNYKLKKTFMDIEVELRPNGWNDNGYSGFPDEEIAPCPVNIITLIDGTAMNSYSFIFRHRLNQQLLDLEKDQDGFKQYLKDKMRDEDNTLINNIYLQFYDSEEAVIEAFFDKLHEIDPDFISSWNQGFDCVSLLNRLKFLYSKKRDLKQQGISAYDKMLSVVCDQKYMLVKDKHGNDVYLTPKAYYKQNKDKAIVDRIDLFTVLDGVNWFDSMLYFSNIRKSSGQRESYALNAIANEELGKEKLDYSGCSLKDLPWKNYKKFVEYNIRDVLLLLLLENKNLDMDMVQRLQDITNTRKEKVFKKTVSLKNFVCKFAEEQGFVMGNNKNAQYGNDSDYFEREYLNKAPLLESDKKYIEAFQKKENFGAYVGDPNLNDYCGIPSISGKPSMFLFKNVFD